VFPRLVVDVAPDHADRVAARLFALGATGLELRDRDTLQGPRAAGRVTMLASFATSTRATRARRKLGGVHDARLEPVIGDAWREAWKEGFRPFRLGRSVLICPPWDVREPAPGERVLALEPGRAFGTGLHATTALAAERVEAHARLYAGREVLDVGCGAGILGLIAVLFGASRARAIDTDADAIAVARENAARNGLAARLRADTASVRRLRARYPLVVANIEATALVQMAPALRARVEPGGVLVLSGVLAERAGEVKRAYAPMRLAHCGRADEWVALEMRAGT
jgi:ribosomal protein L11 methyltransferase